MPADPHNYWFPAKRYGWGWGLPVSWQGWLVLVIFFTLIAVGIWLFPPHKVPGRFIAYVVVTSVIFAGVCWMKGEPPRWRWGKE
jgi:hypothetical protein